MTRYLKVLGLFLFLPLSTWAFLDGDTYQELDQQLFDLQNKSQRLLSNIKTSLKERNPSSPEGQEYLATNLPRFKEEVKKLKLIREELSLTIQEDIQQENQLKALSKKLEKEALFLGTLERMTSQIGSILNDLHGPKRKIKVSGDIEAGLGISGTKTNSASTNDFLFKTKTFSEAQLTDKFKTSLELGYARDFAVSPFSTTDIITRGEWKPNEKLTIRPILGFSDYDDLNDDSLGYKTFQIGAEEHYKRPRGRWSFTTSQIFRNNSYNVDAASFSTLELKNSARKKIKKGSLGFSLNVLKRSNDDANENQNFTTISPSAKWIKEIDALTNREIKTQIDLTNYKNSPTQDNFRFNTHMLTDTRTRGGGKLSYGPTFTWSEFSENDNSSYVEPGYQRRKQSYNYLTGNSTERDRYYFHHSKSDETDFLKWDSQKTYGGKKLWNKFRVTHTKQKNLKLSLAFDSPHDGEQSFLYQWRPKLNFQHKELEFNFGPIIGHNLFLDLSHYKNAKDLEDSGVSTEDPFKVFIENDSNSYQYGLSFDASTSLKGFFVKSRQGQVRLAAEFSRQVNYFAEPKNLASSLAINFNVISPLTKKLDLAFDLTHDRSNSRTSGTDGDPLKRYAALLSLKAPFSLSFPGWSK